MTIDYVVSCYLEKLSMTILDSTFQEHFKFPSFCNLHIVAGFFQILSVTAFFWRERSTIRSIDFYKFV